MSDAEAPVLLLFTYRFWDPVYRNYQTLDCGAVDQAAALASALRFLKRENRRRAEIERVLRKRAMALPRHKRRAHRATALVRLPRQESDMVNEVEHAAKMRALRAAAEAAQA